MKDYFDSRRAYAEAFNNPLKKKKEVKNLSQIIKENTIPFFIIQKVSFFESLSIAEAYTRRLIGGNGTDRSSNELKEAERIVKMELAEMKKHIGPIKAGKGYKAVHNSLKKIGEQSGMLGNSNKAKISDKDKVYLIDYISCNAVNNVDVRYLTRFIDDKLSNYREGNVQKYSKYIKDMTNLCIQFIRSYEQDHIDTIYESTKDIFGKSVATEMRDKLYGGKAIVLRFGLHRNRKKKGGN